MNTSTATLGADPATQDSASNNASEQQHGGDIGSQFANLTEEQQAAILFPEESGETPQAAIPAPEPQAPESTNQEPGKDVDDEQDEPEQPGKTGSPKRVSVRSLPEDQQVMVARAVEMVRSGEAPDIATATSILSGKATTAPDPNASQQEPTNPEGVIDPELNQAPTLETLEAELTDLRNQRKVAKENFDADAEDELSVQIETKLLELAEMRATARIDAKENQAKISSYKAEYEATVEQIEAQYPELQDENSPFSRVFDGMVAAARARRDVMLSDPKHLAIIAKEVSDILNVQPVTKTQTQTPLPAQPPRVIPNGSAVAPTHIEGRKLTGDDALRYIQNASLEELDALLDA